MGVGRGPGPLRNAAIGSPGCGQSRRFCDVCFSVRYPQYRTLSRPIGTGLPAAFLRPNCLRPAQLRQLRRSVLDWLRDMSCICGRQRPGISTAPNPRGTCSRSACPGFCPMAVWRRIAQDRRGADHRPLDSRIKGARCAAVGRVTVQKLIATFLASPHIARIRVLLCAQQVSAMCVADDMLPRVRRGAAGPADARQGSRLARPAPPADGLDWLRLPRSLTATR